jgi:uncharacterized protein YodC (DUF2158 family)
MLQIADSAYHIGQTVYLKSGSPALTVIASDGDKTTVEWDGGDKTERHAFPSVCLKPIPSESRD